MPAFTTKLLFPHQQRGRKKIRDSYFKIILWPPLQSPTTPFPHLNTTQITKFHPKSWTICEKQWEKQIPNLKLNSITRLCCELRFCLLTPTTQTPSGKQHLTFYSGDVIPKLLRVRGDCGEISLGCFHLVVTRWHCSDHRKHPQIFTSDKYWQTLSPPTRVFTPIWHIIQKAITIF